MLIFMVLSILYIHIFQQYLLLGVSRRCNFEKPTLLAIRTRGSEVSVVCTPADRRYSFEDGAATMNVNAGKMNSTAVLKATVENSPLFSKYRL